MSEYSDFNTYCLANFSILAEPLYNIKFGFTPSFDASGDWVYASRNSACIAFKTTLPCKGHLNWGSTSGYGNATSVEDRYYFLHVHYITGLSASTTYHYQISAVDENGNVVATTDRTFTTQSGTGWIDVPGALSGPTYTLFQPNKTYILTQDIVANTRAFSIVVSGVTLDLNGFTVTYDNGTPAVPSGRPWNEYVYVTNSTFGVHSYSGTGTSSNSKILNGKIVQGANNGAGDIGQGFNPIYINQATSAPWEIAGITAIYAGGSIGGILARFGKCNVHHNAVQDNGTVIDNRSQAMKAIWCETSDQTVQYNLIKRARHQGINSTGSSVNYNEIYLDNWATNGFGVLSGNNLASSNSPRSMIGNLVFGTGYNPVGVAWASRLTCTDNFLYLIADTPSDRSNEYGTFSSVNGIRLTQYIGSTAVYTDLVYQNNVAITKARNGATHARTVEIMTDPNIINVTFATNIIKAETLDSSTDPASCFVLQGLQDKLNTALPIYYRGNELISNVRHFRFGDNYGVGGRHRFVDTTITKIGSDVRYNAIEIGYYVYHTYESWIIDSNLGSGVDLTTPTFSGTGIRDYSVGHTTYITAKNSVNQPIINSVINVADNITSSPGWYFQGTTDSLGRILLYVLEDIWAAPAGGSMTHTARTSQVLNIAGYQPLNMSGALFAIKDNPVPVDVVFPTPTATIQILSVQVPTVPSRVLTVLFTSSGVTGNVRMDLSRDGGSNYETVVASQVYTNTTLTYSVGTNVGANCRVKITSLDNPAVFVESGIFSLGQRYKSRLGRLMVGDIR